MYKTLRYYLRYLQAVLRKYYPLILVGFIVLSGILFILPRIISQIPTIRSVKRIAVIGRYTLTDLPLTLQNQLSLGLTRLDESGSPSAAVAVSWQATDSGKTYIFQLDPSLKWQDGTPLKSQDIKYNFRDASVEYPDDTHLVIRLKEPFAPLPSVINRPLFKSSLNRSRLFRSPDYIGLGTYRLKSFHYNGSYLDRMVLVPAVSVNNLPELKYNFYSSANQARLAFELGEVDMVMGLPDLGNLNQWKSLEVQPSSQTDRYVAIFFNNDHPDYSGSAGRNLRLALTYAIDKTRWEYRADGPIPEISWAYNPDLRQYDQDTERAKLLLNKVEKIPDKITLSTVPAYLWVAEQVKSDWQAIGLQVDIQAAPDVPTDYQILLVAQAIPPDPDQYNLWHSTVETTNLSRFKNPRIDKLLEDGRKTINTNERRKIYADFQKFLLDECPAAFLFYPQTFLVSRK